jgi:hypothetical protein
MKATNEKASSNEALERSYRLVLRSLPGDSWRGLSHGPRRGVCAFNDTLTRYSAPLTSTRLWMRK